MPHIMGTNAPLPPSMPTLMPTMKQSIDMANPIKQASFASMTEDLSLSHSTGSLLRKALISVYIPNPPSMTAPIILPNISEMILLKNPPKHTAALVTAKDMIHIMILALKGVLIPEKPQEAPMLKASMLAAVLNRKISVIPTFSPRSAWNGFYFHNMQNDFFSEYFQKAF